MKSTNKPKRKSGDQTREAILCAARKLFVKRGFGATSLFEIAKDANVNHSLIFHHFGSKQNLWKTVKQSLANQTEQDQLEAVDTEHGLRTFLTKIITERFEFYSKHADMLKMADWQRLEEESDSLMGGTSVSPDSWRDSIILLQQRKEIKPGLDPDGVCLLIMLSLSGAFSNYRSFARDTVKRKQYIQMIIDVLTIGLGPDV